MVSSAFLHSAKLLPGLQIVVQKSVLDTARAILWSSERACGKIVARNEGCFDEGCFDQGAELPPLWLSPDAILGSLPMTRVSQFVLIVAIVPLLGSTPAGGAVLTRADIPSYLPPTLKKLIEQTFSSDFHERKNAAKQIGEMHERAAPAVPFLIRLLSDRDLDDTSFKWQYYVNNALVAIGEPALDACIDAANDRSSGVQFYAMECLTKFESSRAVDALVKLLESPNPDISQFAAVRFTIRRDPRSVEPLLKVLQAEPAWFWGDHDKTRHTGTVEALGFQRDQRAVPNLLNILRNPKEDEWLRAAAARSLGQISKRSVYPILIDVFQDRTAPTHVRSGAALGLGAYCPSLSMAEMASPIDVRDDARILTLLGNVLNNDDESLELQIAAAQAMGELGNQKAVKVLIPLANAHAQDALRFLAAVSVVKLTGGATRDVGVLRAIKNYRVPAEGPGTEEQYNALAKIAEHGKWPAQFSLGEIVGLLIAIPVAIGAIGVPVVRFIIRKCRRQTKVSGMNGN